nr:hypothetical protein [Tanacetum cinerariifolium]
QAGLVLTDVNQDGYLDVLTGDSKNNLLAIRLNDGTGDFSLPTSGYQNAPVGAGLASIATGDIDGDGDLDFVTANTIGNSASVWLNSGTNLTTGFYFNTSYTVSMGSGPTAVSLADIDNDGDLDLLTTNAGTSTNPLGEVHVSRNSGIGTFGAYTAVAVGLQPSELTLADIDSDSDLDLLTANAGAASGTGGRIFTYLNTAGSFAAQGHALRLSRDATLAAIGVTLGDVDGDGDLDVLTSDDRGNVVSLVGTNLTDVAGVYFNGVAALGFALSGSGTSLNVVVPAGASSGTVTVATEDAGIAVSPSSFTVTVPVPVLLTSIVPTRNSPAVPPGSVLAATFTAPITAATAGNIRVFGNQRRGRRPGSLTGNNSHTLSFDPDQDFMPGEQISLSLPASLRAADGNAVRQQVVQFTAAVGGTGRHDFFLTTTVSLPGTGTLLLGDVDNDGDLDLAACGGRAGVRLQLNRGGGTFTNGATLSNSSA